VHAFKLFKMKASQQSASTRPVPRWAEALGATLVLSLSLYFGLFSLRYGFAQLLTLHGRVISQLQPIDAAIRLSPNDPTAHLDRSQVLRDKGQLAEAVIEAQKATALNPNSFLYVLELGRLQEETGDTTAALASYKRSTDLAPSYVAPRWSLGNLLFRSGSIVEAFQHLRLAGRGDPQLMPAILDMASAATRGDATAAANLIAPEQPREILAAAEYFAGRGNSPTVALELLVRAAPLSEQERKRIVQELINGSNLRQAYLVSEDLYKSPDAEKYLDAIIGKIPNAGFESPIDLEKTEFGWKVADQRTEGVSVSLSTEAHEGARSLLLSFNGKSNPGTALLEHLLLVKPGARYALVFLARAKDLTTGGMPVIAVQSVRNKKESNVTELARLQFIGSGTSDWKTVRLEFTVPENADAVKLSFLREGCPQGACPAFGQLWLDEFALSEVANAELR
jgi:tetratricopeptide (TPR) repeat protein